MSGFKTGYCIIVCALLVISPLFNIARSQQVVPSLPTEEFVPMPDLVPIEFQLKRYGGMEVMSFQRGTNVYLPVREVFNFLRIKNTYDPVEGVISGFFVSPDTPYVVDGVGLEAKVGDRKTSLLRDEVALRGDSLYLRVDMFNRLFGLPVEYRPRALAASLATSVPLPAFQESQIHRLENELNSRSVRLQPEISFGRVFSFISGGRLDYSLAQTVSPLFAPARSFTTRVTGTVLGGDAETRLFGDLSEGFNIRQARARWKYVPIEELPFTQVVIGDLTSSGMFSSEMYGLQLTNHPASPRILFSDETFRGPIESDRGVYLFQNSRLVSVKHDTSAMYTMDANLRYGVNYVDVREFGYWGERFGSSYRVAVPSTLVPPGEVDYDVSAGRLRFTGDPWHGNLSTQWGVSSRVTAGVQTEFYDIPSLPTKIYPSFSLTSRLTDYLIGEGLVSPNAMNRGSLSLTLPSLVGGSFTYTTFKSIRLFNPRNQINEIAAQAYLPFSLNGERFQFDVSASQTILVPSRERRFGATFSAFVGLVSPRVSTQYAWNYVYGPNVTHLIFHETEPSLRARLPANLFLSIATPYDHISNGFRSFRVGAVLQPLPDFVIQFQSDRNFKAGNTIVRLNLQYLLPFARVTAGATSSSGSALGNRSYHYDQTISGSMGAVPELGEFFFDNSPTRAAYGEIVLVPFIDENANGVRDPGEQLLTSARVHASTIEEASFQLTSVPGLGWVVQRAIPYQSYTMELEQKNLDNPLWIPRYHVVEASAAPGNYTFAGVPVVVGGALRGTVMLLKGPRQQLPVENLKLRVREDIADEDLTRFKRERFDKTVETFSTGDYEIIGLPPGKYVVTIDAAQLASMGFQDRQISREVQVEVRPDGDMVEGVNFVLIEKK